MAKNLTDFKNDTGEWQKFVCKDNAITFTQAGRLWYAVHSRCKVGGAIQKNSPSYIGTVNGFPNFQFFADWCQDQKGYGVNTPFHLDKDLIGNGQKIYSEKTCLFLPREINHFLERQPAGILPQGVRRQGSVFATICGPSGTGLKRYVGLFETPELAAKAYKERKELIAKILANKWKHSIDNRAYEAMMEYTFELEN